MCSRKPEANAHQSKRLGRRGFLASTAAVATGGLLGGGLIAGGGARAFTLDQPAGVELEESYRLACSKQSYHDELVAEVMEILKAEGADTDERVVRETLAAVSCPMCGCPLNEAV